MSSVLISLTIGKVTQTTQRWRLGYTAVFKAWPLELVKTCLLTPSLYSFPKNLDLLYDKSPSFSIICLLLPSNHSQLS
jgi:hypothetical protein